jgi:uncharacterized membrane protein YfhO
MMAYPFGADDKSSTPIYWFIAFCVAFIMGLTMNVILIHRTKTDKKEILDYVWPFIGLIPIYITLKRINGFYNPQTGLFVKAPVLAILFYFVLIAYLFSVVVKFNLPIMLRHKYDYYNEGKVEKEKKSKVKKGFFDWFTFSNRPLYVYVITLFIIGTLFFSSVLFTEHFTIPLGGDFTQQQIQFYLNGYDDWWRFLKTGHFPLWDTNTFLGVNNIGSNSFYYALNPFFLPILLFPRSFVMQGMSILMIAKFVLAALTMRYYLKYLNVSENTSRIFGLIYAFSGWNVYYLWFNHFMEVAVMFPLVFLGIEKIFKEKQPYFLILALGVMGLANYFFLVTTCIVGVLYAGFRFFQLWSKFDGAKTRFKIIGLGVFGFALGILLSGIAFFPGLSIALNSDRVTNATYFDSIRLAYSKRDWALLIKYVTKWETQNIAFDYKKYYPLISFLFPTISDRSVTLLNKSSYDNTISSLFAYTPVILFLIPSLIHSGKKHEAGPFVALGFFLFAIFTPVFYSIFHGFSKEYGRWQLFPLFSLITYVAISYDKRSEFKRWYFDVSFIVVTLLMGFTFNWAYKYQNTNSFTYLREREYVAYYQFAMVFIVYIIYRYTYKVDKNKDIISLIVGIEAIVMGTLTMSFHGTISYKYDVLNGQVNLKQDEEVVKRIKALDGSYYRVYSTSARKGRDNLPMALDYNGVTTFHSLYNFELMDFNYWSKINYNYLGWSLGVHEHRPFLDEFLNIKYYVMKPEEVNPNYHGETIEVMRANVPLTHTLNADASTENRVVYSDENMFTTGFGVSNLISYQIEESGEVVDQYRRGGKRGVIKAEETYLTSGIVNLDDYNEITAKYPSISGLVYDDIPLKATMFTPTASDDSRKFTRTKYYCSKPFPVTNLNVDNLVANGCSVNPSYSTGRYQAIVFNRTVNQPFNDGNGVIIIDYSLASPVDIFLIGPDGKIVTYDTHTNPSGSLTYKTLRGFSVTSPVSKIVIVNRVLDQGIGTTGIYVYDEATVNEMINSTKKYPLENVKWSQNRVRFATNYDEEKFVVTTIPYDKGWHVAYQIGDTREGAPLKVYKTHGGFVGFVAQKGYINYSLLFVPEQLMSGFLATFSSLYIAIFGLVYVSKRKKKSDQLVAK